MVSQTVIPHGCQSRPHCRPCCSQAAVVSTQSTRPAETRRVSGVVAPKGERVMCVQTALPVGFRTSLARRGGLKISTYQQMELDKHSGRSRNQRRFSVAVGTTLQQYSSEAVHRVTTASPVAGHKQQINCAAHEGSFEIMACVVIPLRVCPLCVAILAAAVRASHFSPGTPVLIPPSEHHGE